jgi:hypothetical protein
MPPGPAEGPVLTGVTLEVPSPPELASLLVACGLRETSAGARLTDGVVDVQLRPGRGRLAEIEVVLPSGPEGHLTVDGMRVHRRVST